MKSFIVRVELHDVVGNEYELLHKDMERDGFTRTLAGTDNLTYVLPSATYAIGSPLTASGIHQRVFALANIIRPEPWVLVLEFTAAVINSQTVTR